jgi:hypothetical protein
MPDSCRVNRPSHLAVSRLAADFYAEEGLVKLNEFISKAPNKERPPSLHDPSVRAKLPVPFWDCDEGAAAVDCYWKTWEIAFGNLERVHHGNGFIEPYIDTVR